MITVLTRNVVPTDIQAESLKECRTLLKSLLDVLGKYNKRASDNAARRLLTDLAFAFGKSSFRDILERLERQKSILELALIALDLYHLLY